MRLGFFRALYGSIYLSVLCFGANCTTEKKVPTQFLDLLVLVVDFDAVVVALVVVMDVGAVKLIYIRACTDT